jgi:hypothetical protein
MTTEVHDGALESSPALHSTALKKSWREKRQERRRRRIWLEEALAWVLVPIIFVGAYWFIDAVLAALGSSPSAIVSGISQILAAL